MQDVPTGPASQLFLKHTVKGKKVKLGYIVCFGCRLMSNIGMDVA